MNKFQKTFLIVVVLIFTLATTGIVIASSSLTQVNFASGFSIRSVVGGLQIRDAADNVLILFE